MSLSGEIRNSLSRGLAQLIKRPIYVIMMIVVPLLCAFFLLSLMQRGSVAHVPVGIVDLDNSSLSRRLVRNMNAFQQVDVVENYLTFEKAREAVQKGEIFGFFYIPSNFEEQALGGRTPKVSYYINYAYYAPGSMQYKGFKTISLLTNGGIVQTVLRTVGLRDEAISATLQPYNVHTHMRGNPWLNYSYYLNMSFIPCLLALFVLLVTTFSIGQELKLGLSRKWLNVAGDSMPVALFGKLFPQFCVFTATGWAIQFMMFVIYGLPFNGNAWNMILAMPLFIAANQSFATFIMTIVPNFRLGSTICVVFGMLSFSFCGFSLPQESLYNWIEPFGFLVPIKYYFLISIDQALNGLPFYYSRWYYVALLAYLLLPFLFMRRFKRECKNPVYLP